MASKWRTDWFQGKVKPVRVGVYQRNYEGDWLLFSYWDGQYWGWTQPGSPKAAAHFRYPPSSVQELPWRGVPKERARP